MKIETFIIHLERAVERRQQVEKIAAAVQIPARVLPAIDWKTLPEGEFQRRAGKKLAKPHFPFTLQKSEIACFLSHRQAWAEISRRGLDAALIIEDDIEINPSIFNAAFELALPFLPESGFIRFPERRREGESLILAQREGQVLFRPAISGLGMVAQLVDANCARQLLTHSETFDRPVDGFLQLHWLHGVEPLTVFPSGIREVSKHLGGSTIAAKKSLSARVYAEFMRPLYRHRLARLARTNAKRAR